MSIGGLTGGDPEWPESNGGRVRKVIKRGRDFGGWKQQTLLQRLLRRVSDSAESCGGRVRNVTKRGRDFGAWKQQNLVQRGIRSVDRQPDRRRPRIARI